MAENIQEAATAGNTGHTIHDPILDWSVWDFVREMVAQNDPTLRPAYDALENHPDASVRRRWEQFQLGQESGEPHPFFFGRVGNKRPDVVEVMLSSNHVSVTDASFAYGDLIHNFKTAFYRVVLERLIMGSIRVTAIDYRSPWRQTPVGS